MRSYDNIHSNGLCNVMMLKRFILGKIVDPDEMSQYDASHLGLKCLSKYHIYGVFLLRAKLIFSIACQMCPFQTLKIEYDIIWLSFYLSEKNEMLIRSVPHIVHCKHDL